MDAFMRMVTGKEERTIADRISDPNRPTWEQYKKENADKLDLNDNGEKEMKEYRKKLDAAREKVGALMTSSLAVVERWRSDAVAVVSAEAGGRQQLQEEEEEAQEALAPFIVGGFEQRGRAPTLQTQESQEEPFDEQEEPQAQKGILGLGRQRLGLGRRPLSTTQALEEEQEIVSQERPGRVSLTRAPLVIPAAIERRVGRRVFLADDQREHQASERRSRSRVSRANNPRCYNDHMISRPPFLLLGEVQSTTPCSLARGLSDPPRHPRHCAMADTEDRKKFMQLLRQGVQHKVQQQQSKAVSDSAGEGPKDLQAHGEVRRATLPERCGNGKEAAGVAAWQTLAWRDAYSMAPYFQATPACS
ncbi:hypothetical protein ON010_g18817 [Phytophthora cinnamomi]|nr:hypothetical protein ON010_g18817 [Phytophthora cinnamomi]